MGAQRTIHGLLVLVFVATVGVLLVYIPPQILAQYKSVAELGRGWVYAYFTIVGLGGLILLVCTVWIVCSLWMRTRRKEQRAERRSRNPSALTREQQEQEITDNLAAVAELKSDAAVSESLRAELEPLVDHVAAKRAAATLEIVAFGTISSGKSSLLNALAGRPVFATDAKGGTTLRRCDTPWPGLDKVRLVDTPGLGEVDGEERGAISAAAAKDADLVLLTVDGPLRDCEFRLLQQLRQMEKCVLVCLNKEDWYPDADRDLLLAQLREQVQECVAAENVVAVRAQPVARPRVRLLPDGQECREDVEVAPDIGPLAERMLAVVRDEGPSLLLANLLLQSRGLVAEAQRRVQEALDQHAWQVVERYMWGAGGAAALSPFPLVDLAAGCAISSKMVMDLARVYRQEIDTRAAVSLLGQLGKNVLAVAGVTAATPAVAAVVASLLKTVPGAGTIAGGLLQGIVQAFVTRWIGGVFIAYFRDELQRSPDGLAMLARREWERVTALDELRRLVQAARQQLTEVHRGRKEE
jgi:uncharacterized protein (DUF697 family)/GTP-binding protein EngB required for normal cell division